MQSQLPVRHAAWIARCLGRGDLAPVGPDDIAELSSGLGESRHRAGSTIFRAGEAPARVHIVREGAVELSRELRGRRVALQVLRAGDVFGDVPLFVRMVEPFDARAIEDSLLLSIDSVTLYGLLERRPRLALRWLVSVAARMSGVQERLVDLLAGSMEAQVASLLLREGESGRVTLSQAVIAELVGGRRTSVNRVLRKLEKAGVVRLRYRAVEIVDEEALVGLSGAGE